jgi:hypothetical protein
MVSSWPPSPAFTKDPSISSAGGTRGSFDFEAFVEPDRPTRPERICPMIDRKSWVSQKGRFDSQEYSESVSLKFVVRDPGTRRTIEIDKAI